VVPRTVLNDLGWTVGILAAFLSIHSGMKRIDEATESMK
jgi:hypothetical protein